MIHVCYGLYDRDGHYSKFVGTSIASICENTNKKVTIHILHDNTLTSSNIDKFNKLVENYKQKIQLHNVEKLLPDKVEEMKQKLPDILKSNYSIATLYRLLIPDLMKNISKIIYLDADIIVNRDINDLWNVNITNKPIAAVPEITIDIGFRDNWHMKYLFTAGLVENEDYFNAGVLVLNLDYLRNNDDLSKGYKFVCEHSECKYFDQDILNYCFSKNYVKLDADFDMFANTERRLHNPCKARKAIYHFVGDTLQLDMYDDLNRLYLVYFSKTPWFNADMMMNLYDKIVEIYDSQKILLLQTTIFLEGKGRMFFVSRNNFNAIGAMFQVKNGETLIDASDPNGFNMVVDLMKKYSGQRLFFIFVNNYEKFRDALAGLNFIEGRDFVNGMNFLPSHSGVAFETNHIIRSL